MADAGVFGKFCVASSSIDRFDSGATLGYGNGLISIAMESPERHDFEFCGGFWIVDPPAHGCGGSELPDERGGEFECAISAL